MTESVSAPVDSAIITGEKRKHVQESDIVHQETAYLVSADGEDEMCNKKIKLSTTINTVNDDVTNHSTTECNTNNDPDVDHVSTVETNNIDTNEAKKYAIKLSNMDKNASQKDLKRAMEAVGVNNAIKFKKVHKLTYGMIWFKVSF